MLRRYILSVLLLFLFSTVLLPVSSSATSWIYPFVVWEGYIYEVVDESVPKVDRKIGHVTRFSDMESYSGNFSNSYKRGTKYFSIPNIKTEVAIAIEVDKGEYKKALRRAKYQGGKYDWSSIFLLAVVSFTIFMIGLTVVEKRVKRRKA